MNKLKINFENCYGIKKLNHEFDFSNGKTFSIYAPNWVMKTSFTKTFGDYILWKKSKDFAFPNRQTKREILDENNIEIDPNKIFVVNSYDNPDFSTEKLSLLLVNSDLKRDFTKIYQELQKWEEEVIKELKKISWSSDCKWEIISAFASHDTKNILDIWVSLKDQLNNCNEKYNFKYNDVFDKNGKVKKFLETYKNELNDYINKYNEIIQDSNFFSNNWNKFWTYQASVIWTAISDNSFFEAWHKLNIKNLNEISSADEYNILIEQEKERVINNPDLKLIFEKIDKAISSNADLRLFQKVISEDNTLLVKLNDYESFKKRVWLYYFYVIKDHILKLLSLYEWKKSELNYIIEEAKKTNTLWQKAINEFNDRFINMPFILSIDNKEDAVLNLEAPILKFQFKDGEEMVEKDKDSLLEILSQWEKRALYLLNIIFEIQARKTQNQECIFIFDDIADSFDYKNKYAIIEYLKDISEYENFYQIILTHNFDFFRTISFRKIANWNKCLITLKWHDKIELSWVTWLIKPFDYLKSNFHNNKKCLISMIPFARNIAEYCWKEYEYNKLTSLLHIKDDTETIKISNLLEYLNNIFADLNISNLPYDNEKLVLDLIFETADDIYNESIEMMNLENKVVLSIAIRLKAEIYMKTEINDSDFFQTIGRNQTIKLFKKYKECFPIKKEEIKILEEVNLITPESIHLNSFMYEPILDMSEDYLKILYWKVKNLINN